MDKKQKEKETLVPLPLVGHMSRDPRTPTGFASGSPQAPSKAILGPDPLTHELLEGPSTSKVLQVVNGSVMGILKMTVFLENNLDFC